jgi:hypothetical protein
LEELQPKYCTVYVTIVGEDRQPINIFNFSPMAKTSRTSESQASSATTSAAGKKRGASQNVGGQQIRSKRVNKSS